MEAARALQTVLEGVGPQASEEAALVAELQAGSEGAFAYILGLYRSPVYGLAAHILGNDSDAADVLQNVFVKVLRGIGQFHGRSSLKTWIYRIAVREALNYRRGWFRRHIHEPFSLDEQSTEAGASGSRGALDCGVIGNGARTAKSQAIDPYEKLAQAERQRLVRAALYALPRDYRAVVVLREMEEMPYDEIAELLGIAEGTVKSRLTRGRELLRRKLASLLDY